MVSRSVVRDAKTLEDGRESYEGELTVAYAKLSVDEVMTSAVVVDPVALTVTARSDQPPVQHLLSEWKMVPVGEKRCDINFSVDYRLRSRTLQFLFSGLFDLAVCKVMSAFEKRARTLYGAPRAASS